MPTPTRIASIMAKFGARPLSAVKADQIVMQTAMMFTRLTRSASRAIGTPRMV